MKEKLIDSWYLQPVEKQYFSLYGAEKHLAFTLPNGVHNNQHCGPFYTGIHIPVSTPSTFMLEWPTPNSQQLQ